MRTANEAPKEQQQQQPETVDTSLLSGDMSEQEQAKSSLEKQQGHEGLHPHKESDEDEQSEGLDSVSHQHVEQQDEHDEEDEEADDDEDNSALKKAARAGIRLLEENAQLADEVRHLQLQLTHRNEHCLELQRVLEEKDAQMEQLTQHLRESIFENQSVLSELNKAKEQVASRSSSPVGPISPKRRQAARLEEVEAKFEEAHRRNSILKMELTSAQKKVTELKPLNAQLHEVKEENQVLRHEIEKLEKQMDLSLEERAEESALIQSLRTTIEIYQSLDDPSRSAKQHQQFGFRKSTLFAEADDDDQARRLSKMRRRRFLEQQVMVLQDLLRRYRAQWRQSAEKRSSIEIENGNLLSRIEALNVLVQRQCELCTRASEKQTQENETWKAAASAYETLLQQVTGAQDAESEAEVEHMCFSILRRLVDTWTVDKSKRMKLHDWLTNAIRSTGKRKPLYLPDLSDEIALGFQTLLVPILRHKFGVDVHIEKRLRNVVVTDLKLHVGSTDVEMAKACLQRISRSLMWLMDVESTQMHESEWLGEVSRKKAARVYQGK